MIHWIHTMVWGPGMLVLFLAVGILYLSLIHISEPTRH